MDGALVAIADVVGALRAVGADNDYRLIGGVAVLLHVQRLGLDVPLRATGDADIGVPPTLLRDAALAEHLRWSARDLVAAADSVCGGGVLDTVTIKVRPPSR